MDSIDRNGSADLGTNASTLMVAIIHYPGLKNDFFAMLTLIKVKYSMKFDISRLT